MHVVELERSLRQLRLGGMAAVLRNSLAPSAGGSHGTHRLDLVPGVG